MKKILKLSLILIMTMCIMGNVYAALNCNISVETDKTQIAKNEEFTVNINISNIQSNRGVISLGGTLEYDKDSLELVKMDGQNGWETPLVGASYNETNGKIVITRNGLGKNNETIFKITFKVKGESKQNPAIGLKDITVADGNELAKINSSYTNITIKEETINPITPSGEDNTTTSTNTTTDTKQNLNTNLLTTGGNLSTNNVGKDTSIKSGKLPQTGEIRIMPVVCIGLLIVASAIYYIKIRMVNKKIKTRQ